MSSEQDRELLELAAKAGGIPSEVVGAKSGSYWIESSKSMHLQWNPLTDDGDALRLAVRLNIAVFIYDDETSTGTVGVVAKNWGSKEENTRRAITRAAAALAKGEGKV